MTGGPAPHRFIVNGADSPLGPAVLSALMALGHRVAAVAAPGAVAKADATRPARDRARVRCIGCPDLARLSTTRTAFEQAADGLGHVDGLVHLVDAFDGVPIEHVDAGVLTTLYRRNIEMAVNAVHAVVPHLAPGTAITCVGASSVSPSGPSRSPYDGAKSGVGRLINAFSTELRPRGIRVNAVLPGIIDLPRNRRAIGQSGGSGVRPAAIADMIAKLAVPGAHGATGVLVPMSGSR